eukprot:scaffold16.g149.t1
MNSSLGAGGLRGVEGGGGYDIRTLSTPRIRSCLLPAAERRDAEAQLHARRDHVAAALDASARAHGRLPLAPESEEERHERLRWRLWTAG